MAHEGAMLILSDGSTTREFPMADEMEIGRDEDCRICLPDRKVSRRHALIRRTPQAYTIEDLASKNGTWLNGQPIHGAVPLADGDEVSIAARFKLFFVEADSTAPLVLDARGLQLDYDKLNARVNGVMLDPALSGPQFHLLRVLFEAEGALVAREQIVPAVWPEDLAEGVSEDALDALVKRTRMRLNQADPDHEYIITVRRHGFRYEGR